MKQYSEKYGHYIVGALLVLMLGCILIGCSPVNKWLGMGDDNPVEEAIEFMIQEELGFKIDLTPESEE